MGKLEFTKMQGAGNDFILIDNRSGRVADDEKSKIAARFCTRAISIGADGMMFLENGSSGIKWDFFNADGSSAEMCGNGARCFAVYCHSLGLFDERFTFQTIAGPIGARITADARAEIRLTNAPALQKFSNMEIGRDFCDVYYINTGVPHAIIAVDDIELIDINNFGAKVRYHEKFAPAGTNANFITLKDNKVIIRTYERGVEGETLACGTGSVAAAIVAGVEYGLETPVAVQTRSGDTLNISYRVTENEVVDVYLEGPAEIVYTGVVEL